MAAPDPNLEWLGHVQPTGLVVAPSVLTRYGLIPEEQLRADSDAVAEHIGVSEDGPALPSPWPFFADILGWSATFIAGAPGGPALPDDLAAVVPEADTTLMPTWAVAEPSGGWQMLVRIEGPGVDPDGRGALDGWEATPHQRLERLLRTTGVPTGLLITDDELRLVHAPRGETSGWLVFPLRALPTVGGRPMLGALKLLLESFRLFADATERRLPALLRASRDTQAEVSAKLATQVLGALHELLRGLHAADRAGVERLAAERPAHVYEGLLTVLLRLIFLLYAEDRALIPSRADTAARALYDEGYGVRTLHARLLGDKARHPDTMDERRGAWGRLLALFRLVHGGDTTGGWIRGRGGKLFDPDTFPFLEGRRQASDHAAPPAVTDGCVLRVLDALLVLDGEKLSYRTLDVEQIGSVYETVMGFTVLTMAGPALAIKAGKNNRTPVFVDLAALAATKGKEREKYLKEQADRGGLTARVTTPLTAAADAAQLAEALRPIVDDRASPHGIAPAGTPLLQPTDERRRTGSHYTPRDLTGPIVRHALEPAFARIGDNATPEEVLALKVCDPAMGSGAFLVEACRQLAARLVAAWALHPGTRPPIAPDEDEDLLARRLVAQRCLYGVDRNPLAADLARLSLWLATLARDHEFTFLDHALKSGDSLVGLTRAQISALNWDTSQPPLALLVGLVTERVTAVLEGREEIRQAPDDVSRAVQERRHQRIEARLDHARALGDAVVAAFFTSGKAKEREWARVGLEMEAGGGNTDKLWERTSAARIALASGPHPLKPFHWEIEFPEVFTGPQGGFDAIVGNPPFAGKNTLINGNRDHYLDWLQTLHPGAHGNADIVAHFFRRAFALLRPGGRFGLIATNTIGQGDTRDAGLRVILKQGGIIARATRRLPWPGDAAVVVSVVHVSKGENGGEARQGQPHLDGRPVRRISAYLVEGDLDASPARLAANSGKAFVGMYLLGLGFTFDDEAAAKGKATSIAEMHRLIEKDPRNAERIFPYLGGEEVNTSPTHAHRRYAIDFNDFPLRRDVLKKQWEAMNGDERAACRRRGIVPLDYPEPVAADWPDLLDIVERLVRPERAKDKRPARRDRWWQFAERAPALRTAALSAEEVHVLSRVSSHLAISTISNEHVCAETTVIVIDNDIVKAVVQSRIHEVWARFFASSLKSDLRYGPSDCFETFPFPETFQKNLINADVNYFDIRAKLMSEYCVGLTKIYNYFHDPAMKTSNIHQMRNLHHVIDTEVLRSYGWDDLAAQAKPVFLSEENERDDRYQNRLFWPSDFRDEVLARLLDLNQSRAAEERALGLSPGVAPAPEEDGE
ncbi:Eco57I restriction-modification methylase domain-containing protein [Nitrospirillum amazonense]|uniref:Eco57I restriction-modification methylase domain-containing protein n=1 Tax=Nitrospirillum amazonense TaxID=28077 RepID=UPI002412DEFC|nr:DNA methyltransferase [Nitrospirillum amazonense]MDG3444320.1 N-6 DNA methylase [Nitrospirillum amazonense]